MHQYFLLPFTNSDENACFQSTIIDEHLFNNDDIQLRKVKWNGQDYEGIPRIVDLYSEAFSGNIWNWKASKHLVRC